MGLIHDILLQIESHDEVSVDCPQEKIAFHLLLLEEQDLLRGVVVAEALSGSPQIQYTTEYVRLTATGHDFLDTVRDETVWKQT